MALNRIVRMEFKEDCLDDFLRLFDTVKTQIRSFPGCEALFLWVDESNSCVLYTYSCWQSAADLEAYRHSDLFKTTWTETKRYFAAKPQAFSAFKKMSV